MLVSHEESLSIMTPVGVLLLLLLLLWKLHLISSRLMIPVLLRSRLTASWHWTEQLLGLTDSAPQLSSSGRAMENEPPSYSGPLDCDRPALPEETDEPDSGGG
ncbi:unnamed protein product [Pleuronectes platessa]|uniref:Uncharacterized protein n=1 Tax=Pleuronectes platessa TaxID=8262 RepID=A0A9N7U3F3_PLEPL|nr:unnamed protein product [Pleuronectes platessa]